MEAPPKVKKTVRSKEASAATGRVVDVVMIIATEDLWRVGGEDVEVRVQLL